MDFKWERMRGGRKPIWMLRCFGVRDYGVIIGSLHLVSPKKRRWTVCVNYEIEPLCHLNRLDRDEAMDAAKLILQGLI